MKQIELTQGKVCVVDDADFDWLNQWKWCAIKSNNTFYAARQDIGRRQIKMHRLIMSLQHGDKRVVDHIDHNGLNNQRNNLRICTKKNNCANRNSISNSASKYVGVVHKADKRFETVKHRWHAQIRKDGKTHYLGSFPFTTEGEMEAAKAYDKAAISFHGEFANLNFKTV